MSGWLRLRDAAVVAGVSQSRLRQMLGAGKIPANQCRKEGPMWFISESAAKRIAESSTGQGWPRGKPRK